jgi:spore maturation protein CgeB
MRILFVGAISDGQTSQMRMIALRKLGHDVTAIDAQLPWINADPVSRRLQQMACAGPIVTSLNRNVINAGIATRPRLVWAEKQEYLSPKTLLHLKNLGAQLLHFTPDPYFSLEWKRTKLMDRALPLFDFLATPKAYELEDYRRQGPHVIYMPLGYSEDIHRPVAPTSQSQNQEFSSDVSFLGGWEPRREKMLSAVANQLKCDLKIRGYGWGHLTGSPPGLRRWFTMRRNAGSQPFKIRTDPQLARCIKGGEVYGEQYAWALGTAKIGIGFLRKICPDQHTTRTFEIPACGSLLLADRTPEHEELFEEHVEAEFFESEAEMLDKLKFYLRNESSQRAMAIKGYERCQNSGYSYTARVRKVLTEIGLSK